MSKKDLGLNLGKRKFRWNFHDIPQYCLLQQEPVRFRFLKWEFAPFGNEPIVYEQGKVFLFGNSQARFVREETINFPEQKIDSDDISDVFVDFAIVYKIAGGDRFESDEAHEYLRKTYNEARAKAPEERTIDEQDLIDVIKSKNKNERRKWWSIHHPLHKYLRSENTIINSDDLREAVMNIVREQLTGLPFEVVQTIKANNTEEEIRAAYKKSFDRKNDFYKKTGQPETKFSIPKHKVDQAAHAYENIQKGISTELAKKGLVLVSIRLSNIHLSEKVNEIYNDLQAAEAEQSIKVINAAGDAEAAKKKAEGEAAAYSIKEEAKTDVYNTRKEQFEDMDFKKTLAITEQDMSKVTEVSVNGNPFGSNNVPTKEEILKSLSELAAMKNIIDETKSNDETELFETNKPVNEKKEETPVVENELFEASEPVNETAPLNEVAPVYEATVEPEMQLNDEGFKFRGSYSADEVVVNEEQPVAEEEKGMQKVIKRNTNINN